MSQENVERLTRGYDAFNRGDPSVLSKVARDLATTDVDWGATGAFPGVGCVSRGLAAMLVWMAGRKSSKRPGCRSN